MIATLCGLVLAIGWPVGIVVAFRRISQWEYYA